MYNLRWEVTEYFHLVAVDYSGIFTLLEYIFFSDDFVLLLPAIQGIYLHFLLLTF